MSPGDDEHDLGIDAIERNSATSGAEAPDAVGATEAVRETGPVQAASAVDAPVDTLGVDEISAGLAAGSLTPAEAQSLLIDRVVAAQLPEGADPALVASVRSEVAAALADDPILAELLDPRG